MPFLSPFAPAPPDRFGVTLNLAIILLAAVAVIFAFRYAALRSEHARDSRRRMRQHEIHQFGDDFHYLGLWGDDLPPAFEFPGARPWAGPGYGYPHFKPWDGPGCRRYGNGPYDNRGDGCGGTGVYDNPRIRFRSLWDPLYDGPDTYFERGGYGRQRDGQDKLSDVYRDEGQDDLRRRHKKSSPVHLANVLDVDMDVETLKPDDAATFAANDRHLNKNGRWRSELKRQQDDKRRQLEALRARIAELVGHPAAIGAKDRRLNKHGHWLDELKRQQAEKRRQLETLRARIAELKDNDVDNEVEKPKEQPGVPRDNDVHGQMQDLRTAIEDLRRVIAPIVSQKPERHAANPGIGFDTIAVGVHGPVRDEQPPQESRRRSGKDLRQIYAESVKEGQANRTVRDENAEDLDGALANGGEVLPRRSLPCG